LGAPRDTGLQEVALLIERDLFGKPGDELRSLGSRTNERHFAAKHVKKLRHLIEPRLPEKKTNTSNSGIVLLSPLGPVLFGIAPHAAQLPDFKRPPELTHPHLGVEDAPGLSNLIRTAASNRIGAVNTIPLAARMMSATRFVLRNST
jgi:hypothetical protein